MAESARLLTAPPRPRRGVALSLFAACLAACHGGLPPPAALTLEGPALGTSYSVTVSQAAASDGEALRAAVTRELEDVDSLMSTYRPDSELSRLNRHRALDPFPLSEPTFSVLAAAREVSAVTGGAFDVTVGALVEAWGFGPRRAGPQPSPETIERLRGEAGWRKLVLDANGRYARKAAPALQCDLSAIAKGYAADRVGAALEAAGCADFLVDVGGELLARGANPAGGPWRVGVERPDIAGRTAHRVLHVTDTAIATSGDYRNFREVGGRRLGHVLDPRAGRPAESLVASATVLHSSAMLADAFATALLVLGEEDGLELAEREDLAVLLILRDGSGGLRDAASSRFRARMNQE